MPIYIGTTEISAPYIGSTAVDKVYLGTTEVWSAAPTSNISFVNGATVSATAITIPTHAVGDLMVMFATRNATTFATVPTGWTTIYTSSAVSNTMKIAYKIATATNDASGTWTNAFALCVGVWRGASGPGAVLDSFTASGGSATRNYPAITMTNTSGSSWVARMAAWGHTSTPTAPAGYTQRVNNNTTSHYLIDTDGGSTTAGSLAQTFSPGTAASRLVTLELLST